MPKTPSQSDPEKPFDPRHGPSHSTGGGTASSSGSGQSNMVRFFMPTPGEAERAGPAGPGDGGRPGFAPPEGGQNDVMRLLMAVYRYKWLVVLALVVGLGAGVFATRFIKLQYQADGRIWIETGDREGNNGGPIRTAELLRAQGWTELIRSYRVLEDVVSELRLFLTTKNPADRVLMADFHLKDRVIANSYRFQVAADGKSFQLTTVEGMPIQSGAVGSSVGDPAGFVWMPPAEAWQAGRIVEFDVTLPRDAARNLQGNLQPGVTTDGKFLRVLLTGSDPEQVTQTLNVVMRRFVDVAAELKSAKLRELTRILDDQKRVAEDNLKNAENDLETFRVQTITQPTLQGAPIAGGTRETQDPVYSNYFDMRIAQEDLRRDREALDNILNQVDAGTLALEAVLSVPAAAGSAVIKGLLEDLDEKRAELRARQVRYTNEDEQVKRSLQEIAHLEKSLIPTAVRQLQAQLLASQRELSGRLESASTELREIPPRLIEQARLERKIESANTLHGNISVRYEEARLAALSSTPDVRLLDEAKVPFAPLNDKRPMVVAGLAMGSVGLALLGILLIDRSDRRVRFAHQITSGMGLPILGAVPRVKGNLKKGADREGTIQLQEAFRELRLAIGHAYGTAGPLLLSVTSPETGDGKSTVAGSLAGVFASQGYNVVLVDGDIRRGDLHRSLGVSRAPGLTDYLAGRAELEDVLQPTERGFTLIGSGTRMQHGPELLGTPALNTLIRTLRQQFTVVIVDTPPLGAGVDAYMLGTATGNMVLVVRTGRTDGELAEAKLNLLDRLPIRLLGAVFNDVPASRLYRQYGYLPGYQAEDEASGPLEVARIGNGNGNGDHSAG